MSRLFIISFLLIGLFACTPKIQEASTADFDKANSLKSETADILLSLKEVIEDLDNQRSGIMVQGRELTKAELKFIEDVDDILGDQAHLEAYQADIAKSESAYEPNGKELLYLNEQSNKLVKKIQKKIQKLSKPE